MNGLAGAHDAAVQMIDTSIVRVHQHGARITRNRRQCMGRSEGRLTDKIHVLVDNNGLPVRLALTAGEAHDNRLAGKLLSRLKSGTKLLDLDMTLTGSEHLPPKVRLCQNSAAAIGTNRSASVPPLSCPRRASAKGDNEGDIGKRSVHDVYTNINSLTNEIGGEWLRLGRRVVCAHARPPAEVSGS